MTRAARYVGSALRPLVSQNSSSSRATWPTMNKSLVVNGFRRYTLPALQQEPTLALSATSEKERLDPWANSKTPPTNASLDESGWSPDPTRRRPTDGRREEYFSRLFNPLRFPPELAHRMLTHSSHSRARQGHNGALAFIGRRVVAAYFMLFLHSSRRLSPTDDVEDIAARSLNTHLLGEYVGNEWGVGRELVWAPSISEQLKVDGHFPGLYKVQGETVQAILGAIYHQYGGVVTHRVFHTRFLPLLLVNGGLPSQFHNEVLHICDRMGGKQGRLLLDDERSFQKKKVPRST